MPVHLNAAIRKVPINYLRRDLPLTDPDVLITLKGVGSKISL